MECIILAGGLGTRLNNVVSDVPKCMAPVAGEPFLFYVLQYLERQFVDQIVLSLGYKSEVVIDWLRQKAFTFKTNWVLEKEPLGTGGGLKRALTKTKEDQVFVLNGDTFFDVDLRKMQSTFDQKHKAMLALKPMVNYDRYGSVRLDENHNIIAFDEKEFKKEGLINGGVYLLNKKKETFASFPEKFSFENDFLTQEKEESLQAYISDGYFIDIGVPEDYFRAQEEMKANK